MSAVLVAAVGVLIVVNAWLVVRLRAVKSDRDDAVRDRERIVAQYSPILDIEAERQRVVNEIAQDRAVAQREMAAIADRKAGAESEIVDITRWLEQLRAQLVALDEEATLESFGFYKPRYNFADSAKYADQLEVIRADQKAMLKAKTAAICPVEWRVSGSLAEGRKATNQTLKLMLRAFNGECDAAIAKVKYNNVHVMEARIQKSFEAINGLAEVNQCRVVADYRDLKLKELYLVHEYEEKLQDEKEEQRKIREQIRDEEIAQRQLEKAKADAEREEERYAAALEKARRDVAAAEGAKQAKLASQIEELERRLAEAHANKERAISQAQLTKSGHVYIISNVGSFGEHVYKIGMTRRLDPLERIKELGDASVPFSFDIHAVIYSEDAPALEWELHREFALRRVNRVNERKEFFRVTIDEIVKAVQQRRGEVEVTRLAAAEEYRKTQAVLEAERGEARIPISAATPAPAAGSVRVTREPPDALTTGTPDGM